MTAMTAPHRAPRHRATAAALLTPHVPRLSCTGTVCSTVRGRGHSTSTCCSRARSCTKLRPARCVGRPTYTRLHSYSFTLHPHTMTLCPVCLRLRPRTDLREESRADVHRQRWRAWRARGTGAPHQQPSHDQRRGRDRLQATPALDQLARWQPRPRHSLSSRAFSGSSRCCSRN